MAKRFTPALNSNQNRGGGGGREQVGGWRKDRYRVQHLAKFLAQCEKSGCSVVQTAIYSNNFSPTLPHLIICTIFRAIWDEYQMARSNLLVP